MKSISCIQTQLTVAPPIDIAQSISPFATQIKTAEAGAVPGTFLIHDLSDTDYHQCRDFISATGLKSLIRSPSHFLAWQTKSHSPPTPSQRIGKALHCAVLEPHKFDLDYCTFLGTRRGSAWQNFLATHSTSEILTRDEMDQVLGMRDAIHSFNAVDLVSMLQESRREQSIFWRDEATAQGFRIRCDALHMDAILDLKTTTEARPMGFAKQARQNQYHVQAAHYVKGVEMFSGSRKPFWLVAVETAPPHGIWIHEVGPQAIHRAEEEIRTALQFFEQARSNTVEAGYVNPWSELDW